MSENVQIVLIAAVALVVIVALVIFVLKAKLRSGNISVNRDGVQMGGETHSPPEPPLTSVSGNKIKGDGHRLSARNGGKIDQNEIDGNRAKIDSGNG